ncbi:hypothetical protein OEM_p200250 (plasmid) [Mycobacterium intracellulare subsp. yongonense 05-1390]|nr:hypothetical protein OEM_p200250 [Mycobacterium intracellulare subsp. yongonense 05-1390]
MHMSTPTTPPPGYTRRPPITPTETQTAHAHAAEGQSTHDLWRS